MQIAYFKNGLMVRFTCFKCCCTIYYTARVTFVRRCINDVGLFCILMVCFFFIVVSVRIDISNEDMTLNTVQPV